MVRKAFFLAVALLLPALSQAQVKLLRHPTYSNGKVAFSYLGDLWIANENGTGVQRLTDNQARDVFPRFSPDGNWIAFSSNREGNYDVYVIPATGGKPRQLTFHSADDNVVNWTPGRQEHHLHLRARQRHLPQRDHAVGGPGGGRHRAARPHRLGRLGQLLARRLEDGVHAPPGHLVAQALSRQLCGRPLGDGRGRQEILQARRRGLQGQPHVAHVRPQRRDLLRLQPARQRKGDQVRRAGRDEERQQHLEDLR